MHLPLNELDARILVTVISSFQPGRMGKPDLCVERLELANKTRIQLVLPNLHS